MRVLSSVLMALLPWFALSTRGLEVKAEFSPAARAGVEGLKPSQCSGALPRPACLIDVIESLGPASHPALRSCLRRLLLKDLVRIGLYERAGRLIETLPADERSTFFAAGDLIITQADPEAKRPTLCSVADTRMDAITVLLATERLETARPHIELLTNPESAQDNPSIGGASSTAEIPTPNAVDCVEILRGVMGEVPKQPAFELFARHRRNGLECGGMSLQQAVFRAFARAQRLGGDLSQLSDGWGRRYAEELKLESQCGADAATCLTLYREMAAGWKSQAADPGSASLDANPVKPHPMGLLNRGEGDR